MIPKSLEQMLGLCQRAGQAVSGDVGAELALKKRQAVLLLLADDASERTQEKFLYLASRARVPAYKVGARGELGAALGKAPRATVVIQSKDFANGIVGILNREGLMPVAERG